MKNGTRIFSLLILLSILTSCGNLTEEHRFKKRFDRFYEFLSQDEKNYFAGNDLPALALSLDKRMEGNTNLITAWSEIKDGESISTFSTLQAADFFYTIILREIHRDHFREFMNALDAENQYAFAMGRDYQTLLSSLYDKDKNFKRMIDRMKTEYRLYGFSNEAVFEFLHEIPYPEASRRQLYYILTALNEVKAVPSFVSGDLSQCDQLLEAGLKSSFLFKRSFDALKTRTTMTHLSNLQLLEVYRDIAFRQMDKEAAAKTIAKFYKQENK